jgi:hypothetical protein
MNDVGPQRANPSCIAKIEAERRQLKRSINSDGDKLRLLADWFDIVQEKEYFMDWSSSTEVQEDLRQIAVRLDESDRGV